MEIHVRTTRRVAPSPQSHKRGSAGAIRSPNMLPAAPTEDYQQPSHTQFRQVGKHQRCSCTMASTIVLTPICSTPGSSPSRSCVVQCSTPSRKKWMTTPPSAKACSTTPLTVLRSEEPNLSTQEEEDAWLLLSPPLAPKVKLPEDNRLESRLFTPGSSRPPLFSSSHRSMGSGNPSTESVLLLAQHVSSLALTATPLPGPDMCPQEPLVDLPTEIQGLTICTPSRSPCSQLAPPPRFKATTSLDGEPWMVSTPDMRRQHSAPAVLNTPTCSGKAFTEDAFNANRDTRSVGDNHNKEPTFKLPRPASELSLPKLPRRVQPVSTTAALFLLDPLILPQDSEANPSSQPPVFSTPARVTYHRQMSAPPVLFTPPCVSEPIAFAIPRRRSRDQVEANPQAEDPLRSPLDDSKGSKRHCRSTSAQVFSAASLVPPPMLPRSPSVDYHDVSELDVTRVHQLTITAPPIPLDLDEVEGSTLGLEIGPTLKTASRPQIDSHNDENTSNPNDSDQHTPAPLLERAHLLDRVQFVPCFSPVIVATHAAMPRIAPSRDLFGEIAATPASESSRLADPHQSTVTRALATAPPLPILLSPDASNGMVLAAVATPQRVTRSQTPEKSPMSLSIPSP
jgi:hypothetical protein